MARASEGSYVGATRQAIRSAPRNKNRDIAEIGGEEASLYYFVPLHQMQKVDLT